MREWTEDVTVDIPDQDAVERQRALDDARRAVDDALHESAPPPDFSDIGLPLTDEAVRERTSDNRIDLADDLDGPVDLVPSYGGYLDVVMHGDAEGTQADVNGQRVDFSPEQLTQMIRESPSWDTRPVRLMSCSTGQADYAQVLADDLGVVVYAPDDILAVDGGKNTILHDGRWRRFEPH